MLAEIIDKIDDLSNKVDEYHKETMQGFKDLEAKLCESTLTGSRATLEDFNDYMIANIGEKINKKNFEGRCGTQLSLCTKALTEVVKNFPKCLDSII